MADIVIMPKLGFDMSEGTLVRWVKNEGDKVSKGDILAEIETDKATVEVESGFSGVIRKLIVEQGMVVPVNAPIAVIGTKDEDINQWLTNEDSKVMKKDIESSIDQINVTNQEQEPSGEVNKNISPQAGRNKASPLARRLAGELGIPLDSLRGSGPGGRIVRKDLDERSTGIQTVNSTTYISDKIYSMSKLRQIIGRRMVESKQNIPHFSVTRNYNVGKLLDIRNQYNSILPDGEKISINDCVVKACALALRDFPNLNASLEGASSILQHKNVNIGIAIAVEGGLMTVVCRDSDKKTLHLISQEIKQMAFRARSGKVKPEDIVGSTFSISNLGMYDIYEFIAIVNPPEAAILALGSADEEAIVVNGEIKPGWRMRATLSVDHRISDGAEAARFMQGLGKYLEEPLRLFVQQ